ncbi:cytochrome ubiquinol oxidase subunit I [bacterium]|nr:cytochrome ubiquinol oxidase subunit I [bacterium]MBU1983440.1 cytochrome ubiquinol oxidase subunit I [bacterium]
MLPYPQWNMPLAGGAMVIAAISIFHVVIAHFAVGAGIFNAITEARARRRDNSILLQFVRDNSIFLIYLAFVAGAISGVGIWFTIGVVAPEATTYLIRLFVWFWAIEWVFFAVELAAGYVYYYTWDRLSPRAHIAVGWVYAVSAFLSLVVINGILSFMLTPGQWTATGNVWDAWLNPSFWPSLAMRTVSCLALAGIFAAIVAAARRKKYDDAARSSVVSWGARFLIPLALMPLLAAWYFSVMPPSARALALGGAVAMTFFFAFGVVLSFLLAVYAYFGMLRKSSARDVNLETALLMAAIAFLATASMEFVREGIRKPYVIMNTMYSHGILVADTAKLNEEGVLAHAPWIAADTVRQQGELVIGKAVYRAECLRCHEVNGYNAIVPLIQEWNLPLIRSALDHLDKIKTFMPPFIGTEREKQALALYLWTLTAEGQARGGELPPLPDDSSDVTPIPGGTP